MSHQRPLSIIQAVLSITAIDIRFLIYDSQSHFDRLLVPCYPVLSVLPNVMCALVMLWLLPPAPA
jgi:hypothetical protein